VPPGPGRCTSAGLGVEARVGGASAGHRHDVVVFTNTGAAPCTLRGYPGVSYLDAGGAPAGAPAQRLVDDPPVVSLEPGERAHASLNQGNAMVGTPECGAPVDGVTLQVFPPEETVAKLIPYRSTLCSGAAILHVGVIHPGTEQAAGENAGA
jgi:hypothetical protein